MLLWNGLRHVVVEGKYEKRRGGASLSQSMMRVLLLSEPELEVFSWSPFCYPVLTSSLARNIGGKQYQSYYQVNDALHCGLLLQSVCVCVCVLVSQSCLTLCDSMGCSPLGSSIHSILQARILFPEDLPNPGIEPGSSALQAEFLPSEPSGKPLPQSIKYDYFSEPSKAVPMHFVQVLQQESICEVCFLNNVQLLMPLFSFFLFFLVLILSLTL